MHFNDKITKIKFAKPYSPLIQGYEDLKTKAEICLEEMVGSVVEDSLSHAKAIAQRGIIVYLLTQPWNEKVDVTNVHLNIIRINHLDEVLEIQR